MFYIITVTVTTALVTALNIYLGGIFSPTALIRELLLTLLGILAVFIIDALFAFIIRRLPERFFAPNAPAFNVPKWERNLYRRSKINKWKRHVPEWGCFTGFHKDKLQDPNDSAYVSRFLLESNYGVAGHIAGAIFGFAIIFIPVLHPLAAALPIALVNALLSLMPTAVLRFNTPALRGLLKRNLNKENK